MRAERNNGTVKVSISQRPPYVHNGLSDIVKLGC